MNTLIDLTDSVMVDKKQCKWFLVCFVEYFGEQRKIDEFWIKQYCFENWNDCIRYQKEEAGIYHPDNLMPNGQINENLN